MKSQLVIVESPAKAKTIESFLGSGFSVLSSYGHVRDLPKKDLAIDVENNFAPTYIIPDDKKKQLKELEKAAQNAETVWLATDEDREGEAIAWHLMEALKLDPKKTKRIAFHEITQEAVKSAIDSPREVNMNLVNAQQARRVLDRLVGYKLSPVLWRKVKPGLSAGRVQSVAVRLIVEREREIENYTPKEHYKITAQFQTDEENALPTELNDTITDKETAREIVDTAARSEFFVDSVSQKPATRNPKPPFTTSTLQQIAARKLGFSVRQTMTLAQRLYEAGHITYMRTDSVALAKSASQQACDVIKREFGSEYVQQRNYESRSDAQEAHEAIRPTDLAKAKVASDEQQQRLYELIRNRTLASQMSPAKLNKTTIVVKSKAIKQDFKAEGEVVTFSGWLAAYQDSTITDTLLPDVSEQEQLALTSIEARQTIKRASSRYSEAALVRKLESMGIGRPSTYAPTISTIQDRGYIEKGDVRGEEREITIIAAEAGAQPKESTDNILYGKDKNKLLPTQIAFLVNDFLTKNFAHIVDYDFTKEVEEEFDAITQGKEGWEKMMAEFYKPFEKQIEAAESLSREEASGARELGLDPETQKPIIARMGRYGPMLQLGHAEDDEKPKFAPIPKDKKMHDVTLEDALQLLALPRTVGTDTDGNEITTTYGRYGPYVKSGSLYAPLPADVATPLDVDETTAQELLQQKREQNAKRNIADFGDIKVLNGRFGPYVTDGKKNAKVPDEYTPESLDEETAKKILATPKKRRSPKKKTSKSQQKK